VINAFLVKLCSCVVFRGGSIEPTSGPVF